jgi:hypothetical protein
MLVVCVLCHTATKMHIIIQLDSIYIQPKIFAVKLQRKLTNTARATNYYCGARLASFLTAKFFLKIFQNYTSLHTTNDTTKIYPILCPIYHITQRFYLKMPTTAMLIIMSILVISLYG